MQIEQEVREAIELVEDFESYCTDRYLHSVHLEMQEMVNFINKIRNVLEG